MTTNFDAARARWPDDVSLLPADFQAVYQTWMGLRVPDMVLAAGNSPVAITPTGGRPLKTGRARDLTLSRTPWPAGTPNPPAILTEASIVTFGDNGPSDNSDAGSQGGQDGEVAELRKLVQNQQIAIDKLLLQQQALNDDKDATSAYQIDDATLDRLPKSFRALVPMSRVDRRRLRRDHGGAYPTDRLPKELTLPEDVKNEKSVAAAKITLVGLTKDIISPLMDGNMEVLRMVGTVHSRVLSLATEMQSAVDEGDDNVVLCKDMLDDLTPAVGAVTAALDLVLDLHARMRTNVTNRVERAMGFVDLHDDPNKRGKETFLSEDFQAKIEQKAKDKAHMAWARSGTGGPPQGSLHGKPPTKAKGGGKTPWKANNSRGGSKPKPGKGGRGKGDKGGGRGNGSSSSSPKE